MSADVKLSKTQTPKTDGFFGKLLEALLKLSLSSAKNIITPLPKNLHRLLRVTAATPAGEIDFIHEWNP